MRCKQLPIHSSGDTGMRKNYIWGMLSLLIVFVLFGCSKEKQSDYPQTVINNFYAANYNYKLISTSYNKNGDIFLQSEIQGMVINQPEYKEYQKRPDSEALCHGMRDISGKMENNFIPEYIPQPDGCAGNQDISLWIWKKYGVCA